MGVGFVEKEVGDGGAGPAHGAAGDDEDLPSSLIVILDMDRWARRQDRGGVEGRGAARVCLQDVSGFVRRGCLCGIYSPQASQSFSLHRDGTLDESQVVNARLRRRAWAKCVAAGGPSAPDVTESLLVFIRAFFLLHGGNQVRLRFILFLPPVPLSPHPNVRTDGLPKGPMDHSRVVGF